MEWVASTLHISRDGKHWAPEAPGWQEVTDANVKQAVTCCRTDTRHSFIARCDNKSLCHDGSNSGMSVVTTWRCDVYRLVPASTVCIEVGIKFTARECLLDSS